MTMLGRILAWQRKRSGDVLGALSELCTDTREEPRISAGHVARSLFVMTLARLGSLNALEQTGQSSMWRRYLGGPLPSADTLGRVPEGCTKRNCARSSAHSSGSSATRPCRRLRTASSRCILDAHRADVERTPRVRRRAHAHRR
jgi:hypothetical protein